jgi:transcription-repair coupling factor (superfamily II helicase)
VNGMLERFVQHGFTRTDFVYEPGQFAIRGGILDIYSFGNEKPYRIELFGNEVDSIRIFDPESQLSERKLLQVNIIPNVETQFEVVKSFIIGISTRKHCCLDAGLGFYQRKN